MEDPQQLEAERPAPYHAGTLLGTPLAEDMERPLGRGYVARRDVIGLYLAADNAQGSNPSLSRSIAHLDRLGSTRDLLAALPRDASCLIEGYSAPSNSSALRRFLSRHGISRPTVHAVDLYDLPRAYRELHLEPPDMHFHMADAANLEGIFAAGAFDLVVQDFLLNCVPPHFHASLLAEAARVLTPRGMAIISFSDSHALAARASPDGRAAAHDQGLEWDDQAYSLGDLPRLPGYSPSRSNGLLGQVLRHPTSNCLVHVTPPHGNFEFFPAETTVLEDFARAGLRLVERSNSIGVDSYGLDCRRHRCVLTAAANDESQA